MTTVTSFIRLQLYYKYTTAVAKMMGDVKVLPICSN